MNKTFLLTSTLIFSFMAAALAEQTITLKDGSQIKGTLVQVTDGVYTVKTATMGDVNVNQSNVSMISNGQALAAQQALPAVGTTAAAYPTLPVSSGQISNQQVQTLQSQVMSNPQIMADVSKMAEDPQILQLISDPQLMAAVQSKDANAIASNPNAQALMSDPRMKSIIEKIQSQNSRQ